MTNQIGSHVDKLLLDGFEKAYEDIRIAAKQQRELEEKQKELKEKAQHAFDTIDEIITLKSADEKQTLVFYFNGRVHCCYDLKDYEEQKQEMLNKFTV